MAEGRNLLKRQRHESGQGEADHLDKKLHGQNDAEKCGDVPGGLEAFPLTTVYDMKLRSSAATRAVASTSCTNILVDGGKEVQSGSQAEPMIIDDEIQEKRFIDCLKNEQGMEETKISVRRGTSIARFEIDIMLLPGCKDVNNKQGKNFKTNAKKLLLRCMNAAGNSYGGQVKMDFSEVGFGRQDPIEGLKSFYRDTEQLFKGLHSKEMPVKERTISKCIVVDVPMFIDFRSLQSNIKTPKHQSNEMYSDSEVRHLIKTNIEDIGRKSNTLKVSQDRLKSFSFKYSSKENAWEEGPDTQFKLMAPAQNSGLVGDMLRPGNKLMFYISSFATHIGGIVLFGVEDSGKVDGQVLSNNPEDQHSFQYIHQKLQLNIKDHTAWINSNGTRLGDPCNYFSITKHLVTDVPVGLKLKEHEYLAVVCVCISEFDGVVFGSGSGPEAYKIDPEKLEICQIPLEECWRNLCTEYKIDKVTKELKQMRLNFHSASDKTTVFELDNNASKIREKLFKISPEFSVYPEGLVLPRNGRIIQELFRRNADDEGIILAEKETQPSAVYLLVISKRYGIHFYMLPMFSGLTPDFLEEQCQKKAIALKMSLCCIGGCRANLVIKIHLVQDNMPEQKVENQLLSHFVKLPNIIQKDFIKRLLESYIKVVGSFENKALTKAVGVQILNVLTDTQFETLSKMYHCRELWIHGLAGCGKTILAMQLMKRLIESGEGNVLYVTENKGLESLMSQSEPAVTCMTRYSFVNTDRRDLSHIRNIVMDEVHHYQLKDGDWLEKARRIVADNRPDDSDDEGYLWLFLDMYQKENLFPSGIPPIPKQKARYALTEIVRNTGAIWRTVKQKLEHIEVPDDRTGFYKKLLHRSSCPHDTDGQDVIQTFKSKRNEGEYALYFQVAYILNTLKEEHWLTGDIAILFSKEDGASFFRDQFNKLQKKEMLIRCTANNLPDQVICDSVRRFSGLDKPCVILVEPSAEDIWHDHDAFLALGMSRAMLRLIVIEKLN